MKVEISDYGPVPLGLHIIETVKEFKRNEEGNEFSILFGDFELILIVKKKEDISNLRYSFTRDENDWTIYSDASFLKILLKYNGSIFRGGEVSFTEDYSYGETGERYLELVVDSSPSLSYRIIFHPEYGETLEKMYTKIFHISKK